MALQPQRQSDAVATAKGIGTLGVGQASSSSSSSQISGSIPSSSTSAPLQSDGRPLSDVRLFVANLAPSVSEHDLLTAFKLCGTLRKLDLVFHRSGPQKGQHKGFAFIEYADAQHAARAKSALHGKPLRGRELHVHYATLSASSDTPSGIGAHRKPRQQNAADEAPNKSTMLSLVKNLNRKDSTSTRIAAMEAKLEAIRNRKEGAASSDKRPASSSSDNDGARRPSHLPSKPPRSVHR